MDRDSAVGCTGRRLALLTLIAGCANVEAPPGTGPDFEPPSVLERFPAPGAIVPDLDDDAWIRFDEPVQSPRNLERGLDISPAWDWKFNPRISGFSVRPREGWRPGVVYRIRIPPGVSDLIRNRTRQVIEWTFSTGPEISETRIDGIVYDRETVSGVRDARLLFLSSDSVPYSVVSDTGGVYGMRSLPAADYTVYAFLDQNRNRQLDRSTEPWDSANVSLPEPNSRYAVDLWMLPPDSTPPRLLSVVAFDTVTLSLEFDEPLDPEASLDGASVSVAGPPGREPITIGGLQVGQPGTAFQGDSAAGVDPDTTSAAEGEADPDTLAVDPLVADSLAADSLMADTLAADSLMTDSLAADSAASPDPGAGGRERLQSAELRAMPFRTLVVRLEQALTEDTFRVVASGIPNLRGLTGGGDTTFVYVAPLAPVAPDAEPDSAGGLGPLQEEAPPVQTDSAEAPSLERPPRSGEPRSPASGDG
ncbi:MAG: Ig-like domain-containing protein [marine benthic group bacterium]|nr:Ig-like domain-containing protein [Gemmatimonadota bacterium]